MGTFSMPGSTLHVNIWEWCNLHLYLVFCQMTNSNFSLRGTGGGASATELPLWAHVLREERKGMQGQLFSHPTCTSVTVQHNWIKVDHQATFPNLQHQGCNVPSNSLITLDMTSSLLCHQAHVPTVWEPRQRGWRKASFHSPSTSSTLDSRF